ncbi:MAG TPA: hypothetical protein VJJ21_02440 [Candidatus Nanoarchaeia archaeon]|nr:hypothetical protein [Candidatus Nanoarchaeia archaeon]
MNKDESRKRLEAVDGLKKVIRFAIQKRIKLDPSTVMEAKKYGVPLKGAFYDPLPEDILNDKQQYPQQVHFLSFKFSSRDVQSDSSSCRIVSALDNLSLLKEGLFYLISSNTSTYDFLLKGVPTKGKDVKGVFFSKKTNSFRVFLNLADFINQSEPEIDEDSQKGTRFKGCSLLAVYDGGYFQIKSSPGEKLIDNYKFIRSKGKKEALRGLVEIIYGSPELTQNEHVRNEKHLSLHEIKRFKY